MFTVNPLPILWIDEERSPEMHLIYLGIQVKEIYQMPQTGYIYPGESLPMIAANSYSKKARTFSASWGYDEENSSKRTLFISLKKIYDEARGGTLLSGRRCIVVVNCFYIKSKGQYYRVRHATDEKLFLAGYYRQQSVNRQAAQTILITTNMPSCYAQYESRIPLILPRAHCARYMDSGKHYNFRYTVQHCQADLIFEPITDPKEIEKLKQKR